MKSVPLLGALCLLIGLAAQAADFSGTDSVELHAHLFMKEGMGWMFRGDFNGPLQAKTWQNRFSSMANPETVESSGIRILVVALYAHPLAGLTSLRDRIRTQIGLANEFVASHPGWVIARDAGSARVAIASGKRVMILALEGAAGILENEKDLHEFVDVDGIRIVTLLHLTDDEFGGVAFLKGPLALSTPFAWALSMISPHRTPDGVRVNVNGLTPKGADMARALIKHKVWIDLSHASDASQAALIPILNQTKLPLLYTHTSLRHYFKAERAISDAQLVEVKKSQGIIGLIPSEDMLEGTPPTGECDGGVEALAKQFDEAARVIGAESVMMGSDYNGGLPHLRPQHRMGTVNARSCLTTHTSLDEAGLWNIGQVSDLWKALFGVGAPVAPPLAQSVDRFLQAWERVTATWL